MVTEKHKVTPESTAHYADPTNDYYRIIVNKQRLKLLIRGLRWYQSETNEDTEDFSNELEAMLGKDEDVYEDEKE